MSTSRKPASGGPSKKISSWVRPGVFDVRASALRPVSALIRLDLPTLERPAKATSTPAIGGNVSIEGAAQKNCQSPANNLRPCSIRSASGAAVMWRVSHSSWPGIAVREDGVASARQCPAIHDFFCCETVKTWMPGTSPVMTTSGARSSGLRFGLLRSERRLQIVKQFDLHAVTMHDEALLRHRKQVVPRPVDHQARREAGQHEGEDQRHPGEDHLLGRIRRRWVELELQPHRDAHDERPDAERKVRSEHR